jgi:hypothetical protein
MSYRTILKIASRFERIIKKAAEMPLSEALSILGVDINDDISEIKRKYHRLTVQNHPDRHEDHLDAERKTEIQKKLNVAFERIKKEKASGSWRYTSPFSSPSSSPKKETSNPWRPKEAPKSWRDIVPSALSDSGYVFISTTFRSSELQDKAGWVALVYPCTRDGAITVWEHLGEIKRYYSEAEAEAGHKKTISHWTGGGSAEEESSAE